jgi:hypothetical protein
MMVGTLEGSRRVTLGADKADDTADFAVEIRRRGVTPNVVQNDSGRRSAIDGRTTRHGGYKVSLRRRKCIEEVFGWMNTAGGGVRRAIEAPGGWLGCLRCRRRYNLIRLAKLLNAAA